MFGWCNDGFHTKCIKEYTPFYTETKRGKTVLVFRDEKAVCSCKCHGNNPVVKKKTRRKK